MRWTLWLLQLTARSKFACSYSGRENTGRAWQGPSCETELKSPGKPRQLVCRSEWWRGDRYTGEPQRCAEDPSSSPLTTDPCMSVRKLPKPAGKSSESTERIITNSDGTSHRAGNKASFQQPEWKVSWCVEHVVLKRGVPLLRCGKISSRLKVAMVPDNKA